MSAAGDDKLRQTPLIAAHRAAGARLVPFAGWEMPVMYESVIEEHLAVRTAAGVFDVSHMGEIESQGPGAFDFLQRVLTNDLGKLAVGGGQYSLVCREDGGVLDDLFTYRLGADRYLTVTNASNHEKDLAWFRRQAEGFEVTVTDRQDDYAMLAVQGPLAREMVQAISNAPLPPRMTVAERVLAGREALVCGTGYTGEDGVEIAAPAGEVIALWEALLDAGIPAAGLGARDTLRLEAGLPLHGHELGPGITPLQAGLGWVVSWSKAEFRGREALATERDRGPLRVLRGLRFEGRQPPREGCAVHIGGESVGVITSGNFSPVLGVGIALGFLPPGLPEGLEVEVEVRGRLLPARIVALPFVHRSPAQADVVGPDHAETE